MGAGRTMLVAALTLYGVVGLVLIVSCANVAGLLLARAEERRREIAVCAALGATRWRLVQRFVAESAVIAILGCVVGVVLYTAALALASRIAWFDGGVDVIPPSLPLVYCCALVVAITVACGAAPALAVSRLTPGPALALVTTNARRRVGIGRNLLVILQVAVCFVLLSGAFLLLRGVLQLQRADPGFEVRQTLWLSVRLRADATGARESETRAFERLRLVVDALPGVASVSCVRYLPLTFLGSRAFVHSGDTAVDTHRAVDIHPVGPRYLETMRIPLLRGRDLSDNDMREKGAMGIPVVVNETLARRFFQTSDPIGRRLVLEKGSAEGPDEMLQIVGVARDSKLRALNEDSHPVLYLPELHTSFVVRVTGSATAAVRSLEKAVADNEPGASVQASPMSAQIAVARLPAQVGGGLLAALSALGLVLAITGLYAVITHAVNRRTFEIGVRIALGATRSNITRMVFREALLIVAIGCAIGGGVALVTARVLSPLLAPGQSPMDPIAFGAVAITLALVGGAASLLPARKAARVDPIVALHYD
jgi:putative ABC transport system permease protein